MNIITGYRAQPHITAQQEGAVNAGIIGVEAYVLNVGSKLAASIESNNEIRIADGVLVMNGRAAAIDNGVYDSMTIENGAQGYKRKDLIVATYRMANDTTESIELEVITGTPTTGTPVAPSYTTGDILEGDTIAQVPIYEVLIEGISITSVTKIIGEPPMDQMATRVERLERDLGIARDDLFELQREVDAALPMVPNVYRSQSIASGGSKRLGFGSGNSILGMLAIIGTTQATKGLYLISCATSGSVNIVPVKEVGSTNIRITEQTAGVNVDNNASSGINAYWINLSTMQPDGWW